MKKVRIISLMLAIVLLAVTVVSAQGTIHEGNIDKAAGDLDISQNTTVNGNVTLNMGDLDVLGTVNGNVAVNMGKLTIPGTVNGNVEANMGEIDITGDVSGDVRASMGEVDINGNVGGSLYAGMGDTTIRGVVGGNVDTGLGRLRVDGNVLGDISGDGKEIIINGTVDGDVNIKRGIVELGPNAQVLGRVYVTQGMVKTAEGAQTGAIDIGEEMTESEIDDLFNNGGIVFEGLDQMFDGDFFNNLNWNGVDASFPFFNWYSRTASKIFGMIIAFALAALTFTLFPKQTANAGIVIENKIGHVALWGVLALILAVPLAIMLAITVIGIPIIMVEVLLIAVAWVLGYTALALTIGDRIIHASARESANPLGKIALGVLLVGVLGMIPVAGVLVSLAAFIIAVGSVLMTRFGTRLPA